MVADAIENLSRATGVEARGAVFTRPEVVNFILDLAGYTEDRPLHEKHLLEPSFGGGDFLLPVISRLMTAWRAAKGAGSALDDLSSAIRAVELHRETYRTTHAAVVALLKREGLDTTATSLADRWLSQGDFLLTPLEGDFDFVVGNPPYVRQELIPPPCWPNIVLATARCTTGPISTSHSSNDRFRCSQRGAIWHLSARIGG